MAMNDPRPDDLPDPGLSRLLDTAARELRQHTDHGWARARGSLLTALAAAVRPGRPVLARHQHGEFHVSTTVLRGVLRRALAEEDDGTLLGVAFDVDERDRLAAVTAEVSARFGSPLIPTAERLRSTTREAVHAALGEGTPAEDAIRVHVVYTDVHRARD
jgi:CRP-like cAMP-binding protein